MWTNIYNYKFDFSHIRLSSSASVECEIKKIKRYVLQNKGKSSRIDTTIQKLINYYDGTLRNLQVDEFETNDTLENLVPSAVAENSNNLNRAIKVFWS